MPPRKPLGFLVGRELHRHRDTHCYQVTIFSPKGLYPQGTLHVTDGFLHVDREIAFSVVWGSSWQQLDPELPFSELRILSPSQLRLIAALMLCEKRNGARLLFYPEHDLNLKLRGGNLKLDKPETIEEIRTLVLTEASLQVNGRPKHGRDYSPQQPYESWPSTEFAFDRLATFWERLYPLDYVIARGLYALMKADMLCRYPEFWEEATISCYIALDASFAYIKRLLAKEGTANATAHDAAVWVHTHFNAAFNLPEPQDQDKFFGEMYEQRVMALHPSSRYGKSPFAPMMYDEYMFLRRDLRELFAYFVAGEHGQDYHDDVIKNGSYRGSL